MLRTRHSSCGRGGTRLALSSRRRRPSRSGCSMRSRTCASPHSPRGASPPPSGSLLGGTPPHPLTLATQHAYAHHGALSLPHRYASAPGANPDAAAGNALQGSGLEADAPAEEPPPSVTKPTTELVKERAQLEAALALEVKQASGWRVASSAPLPCMQVLTTAPPPFPTGEAGVRLARRLGRAAYLHVARARARPWREPRSHGAQPRRRATLLVALLRGGAAARQRRVPLRVGG